ncbi:integrase core domain-containing protein [Vibrio sp.]|uniref:integrase core domain-containing protein n=1 Tax=Vibrio sp. TaxID=678 RepID=UPI003D10E638
MKDELSTRKTAIRLRLAGESVESICSTLKRSKRWFHKWWQRYLTLGTEGLYDLTRANHRVARQTPPHIERAVLSVRRRLEARSTPQTRYAQIGAATIREELRTLGLTPLPSLRTVGRILQRAGLTNPSLRLAQTLARSDYPGPQAQDTNQLHQVDTVGPRYLKGDKTRYYFLICKDVFDQAVYTELVKSRKMDGILAFLIHAWQHLGLPEMVQFDNGREFCGFGHSARYLSRIIRLCLRLEVETVFIPPAKPQRNGSVENFNGWFQPLLLNRTYRRACDLRRQLRLLMNTVNAQHVHPQLGYKTPTQYRKSKRLRVLPANFKLDGSKLPISVGKVTFIRLVSAAGTINILEQKFKLGKRLKFQYVKATLYTRYQTLKIYHKGRLIKQFDYELPKN